MPKTAGKKPTTSSQSTRETARIETRTFAVAATSIDLDKRSVEAIVTTETPVEEWDWERWEMVPRVLLTDGASWPGNGQVPLLDNHQRQSTGDQIGSGRELRKETAGVVSRLYFARSAEEQWDKVREGHLTDVSAGFEVVEQVYVSENTTQKVNGREFVGPVNVATKWRLREVSLTPIGADEKAKLRSHSTSVQEPQSRKGMSMNPELKALLVSRGMPAENDDAMSQTWLLNNKETVFASSTDTRQQTATQTSTVQPDMTKLVQDAVARSLEAHTVQRAAHRKNVDELTTMAGCEDIRAQLYECPESEVRKKIQEHQAERSKSGPAPGIPRVTANGRDAFRKDVGDAFVWRALDTFGVSKNTRETMAVVKPNDVARKFASMSLSDLARECLTTDGFDVRGLSRQDVAMAVMSSPERVGLRMDSRDYGGAYHTTGSFALLTENAVNKSMTAGYAENPATWRGPMRQGPSVPDFKQVKRYAIGALPNLSAWPDNSEPQEVSMADSRETYAVEAYAEQISFSWQLLVNDDMGALTTVPFKMGAAASRTVNAVAWAVLTANAAMADGVALFSAVTGNRFRANVVTGSATPTVATVGAMSTLLRLMRGRNVKLATGTESEGPDVLNLTPAYIVGPAALEVTINQLVNSAYDPNASVNTMVHNPTRVLTPVIEPLLDAASATAWYLFANPNQCDTVEVAFLQGHEQPVTWNWMDDATLTRKWGVRQVFTAKAMDYRGMIRHAGV